VPAEPPLIGQRQRPGGRYGKSRGGALCDHQTGGLLSDGGSAGCTPAVGGDRASVNDGADNPSAAAQNRIAGDGQAVGKNMCAAEQFECGGVDPVADDKRRPVAHDRASGQERATVEEQLAGAVGQAEDVRLNSSAAE